MSRLKVADISKPGFEVIGIGAGDAKPVKHGMLCSLQFGIKGFQVHRQRSERGYIEMDTRIDSVVRSGEDTEGVDVAFHQNTVTVIIQGAYLPCKNGQQVFLLEKPGFQLPYGRPEFIIW